MLQTGVAMATTTLRVGTAVSVLPWHNPVLLAEQAATLDVLSGGRVDLGIGKGYRHAEFRGFAISPVEAQARFDESVEVMTRAWTSTERFSHHGQFWDFDEIVVEPASVQTPHPPLWLAAASEASIRRAAQCGYNLLLDQFAPPTQIKERIARYRASGGTGEIAVGRQAYVASSEAEADDALARLASYAKRTVDVSRGSQQKTSHLLNYVDQPGATEAHALFATPDDMCDQLGELGADYVLLHFALDTPEQLRRFARDVMPRLRGRDWPVPGGEP
jgi:alkanesulfonate monooxygenase SsuD/methylene tetrahydromethanopterin reductase-like flavin-dependent oxidoreductase (luciferase family)